MHKKNPQTIRLTLDVAYECNGVTLAQLCDRLQRVCQSAVADGMLTGDTPAEVVTWSAKTSLRPAPLAEKSLEEFMRQRIDDGQLDLEDIPVRLARYGLMDPDAFIEEMRERMGMAKEDVNEDV